MTRAVGGADPGGPAPRRVVVTRPRAGAARRPPRPYAVTRDIDEQTQLGELFMRSLIRAQLRLGLGVCAAVFVLLGGLPLLFALAPPVRAVRVAGLPLPWLLLGAVVYPVLVGTGQTLTAIATPKAQSGLDLALYLVSSCLEVGACLAGVDAAGVEGVETLRWTNTGGSTAVYLIVDSQAAGSRGLFDLELRGERGQLGPGDGERRGRRQARDDPADAHLTLVRADWTDERAVESERTC